MTFIMFIVILAVITLPSIIWLYALADSIVNDFKSFGVKIIWILTICFFPVVGALLYYLIGRNQRRTRYPVGRFVLICILMFPIVMTVAYYLQSPEPDFYIEPSSTTPSKTIQI
jgi:hypothetical protein